MAELMKRAAEFGGRFLKKSVENNGNFLFLTAAAGWILASTAQTIGLMANKDIGKEEKKFLVPQEILDGTFNIASYAAITLPIMGVATKVAKGKFGEGNKAVEGARTLAAIAGGVISSNIVTPLLRNKSSVIVKSMMEKKNLTPPPPEIYDGRTYPNFRAKTPVNNIQAYKSFTKSMPMSGTLKI